MTNNDSDEMGFSHPGIVKSPDLSGFFEAHAEMVAEIAKCDLESLASSIAGLLISPEWQASTYRLEIFQ